MNDSSNNKNSKRCYDTQIKCRTQRQHDSCSCANGEEEDYFQYKGDCSIHLYGFASFYFLFFLFSIFFLFYLRQEAPFSMTQERMPPHFVRDYSFEVHSSEALLYLFEFIAISIQWYADCIFM